MPRGRKKKEVPQPAPADIPVFDDTPQEAPPATSAKPMFGGGYGFNYLDEADQITEEVQKIVYGISNRRKNRTTSFKSMADVRKNMVHMPDLALQYLFGNYGVPEKALIEVIGGEGVGKSSLCHYIEGWFLKQGCPVYHQECEAKPISASRIQRIVSEDPVMGRKIVKAIHFDTARSVKESFEKMVDWIKVMRGKTPGAKVAIPMHVPLLIVIDPWGKLMSKNEAAGFYDYGALKAEQAKDMLDVSNMGHAQAAHRWVRRLPFIMDTFNVTIILVQHQNQKVDMGGATPSFIPEEARKLNNTTKIGGNAFGQLDSLQFVIAKRGALKNAKNDQIGTMMKVKVSKNSYGPEGRVIEYDLISDGFQDTPTKLEKAVRFDRWFSEFCAEKGFMGTTVNAKRYSCPSLNISGARTDEFYDRFMGDTAATYNFGKAFHINGYDDPMGEVLAELGEVTSPPEEVVVESAPEEAGDQDFDWGGGDWDGGETE